MPRPFPNLSPHDGLTRFDFLPAAPADTTTTPDGSGTDPVTELAGLAVPWDVTATRWGIPVCFTADTLDLPADLSTVKLLVQHDDDRPVGYATSATKADDGLRMTWAVDTSHPRAAELVQEVALKWRDGLSIGVELSEATQEALWAAMWDGLPDDNPLPLGGTVREVSACSVPQFNTARLGATATPALARFTQEGSAMPPTAPPIDAPAPEAAPPATSALSMAELAGQLAPFLGAVSTPVHPLAAFANAGEFMLAAREGRLTDDQRTAFALVDQVTTDNPGVIPPAWLTTIVGILDRGRPTVSAFGGPSSAGDSGMSINWPYYDGGFDDLVAKQLTEKTEVHSRKVSIKSASADLETYAGASDISYQLLRRSSPSYREAYTRILTIGYGVVTDDVFATDVLAAATAGDTAWPINGDLETLLAALFSASSDVDDAVGVPADVVLAAPDVFMAMGILTGVVPAPGQVSGTSATQASTLKVNVSGLNVTKDRSLPAGTLLVSSSEAASWAEDGPHAVEGDDVAKLGLDVGIWGMGATRVTTPGGIIAVTTTATPPVAGRSSGASSSKADK